MFTGSSSETSFAHFNVSVEQQPPGAQGHVLVLELVSRQQFGGAVAELEAAAPRRRLLLAFGREEQQLLMEAGSPLGQEATPLLGKRR